MRTAAAASRSGSAGGAGGDPMVLLNHSCDTDPPRKRVQRPEPRRRVLLIHQCDDPEPRNSVRGG